MSCGRDEEYFLDISMYRERGGVKMYVGYEFEPVHNEAISHI